MPTLASVRDQITLRSIERWRIAVEEAHDEIMVWRFPDEDNAHPTAPPTERLSETPGNKYLDRWEKYWWTIDPKSGKPAKRTAPPLFYSDTAYLVAEIVNRHSSLDPKPLQDVYVAVEAWYKHQHAFHVPPQPVFHSTVERAMMALDAVEQGIDERCQSAAKGEGKAAAPARELAALTPNEQAFFDVLTDEPMTGPDIAAKLARNGITTIGESEISKMAKRQQLQGRGVRHRKGAGYYLAGQGNAKATPS